MQIEQDKTPSCLIGDLSRFMTIEFFTLILFCALLFGAVLTGISVLLPLLAGLIIFVLYALYKGFKWKAVLRMVLEGAWSSHNVWITILMIGAMTAAWRASGTILTLVYYAVQIISPSLIVVLSFLLCCLVSVLVGSSLASAATMGVVCMSLALSSGINPVLEAGAILGGIYFGDRWSPVSTSALLVAEVTETKLGDNLKLMFRTSVLPLLVTCLIYLVLGFQNTSGSVDISQVLKMADYMRVHWCLIIPPVLVLGLAVMKISVKKSLLVGMISAGILAVLVQGMSLFNLFKTMVFGFQAENASLGAMLDGGGLISMWKVTCIIIISSSYSGIFRKTPVLDGLKGVIAKLAQKISTFGAIWVTSIFVCMIACNQTLGILLTNQLVSDIEKDNSKRALALENSVVLMAAAIPWCIACSNPLSVIGGSTLAITMAYYLFLVPLFYFFDQLIRGRHRH